MRVLRCCSPLLQLSLFLFLAMGLPLGAQATAEQRELELLNLVATRSRANIERIRTWQGSARIKIEWYHTDIVPGMPRRQLHKVSITFVHDRLSGNIRSDYILEENRNYHDDGTESSYLEADYYSMIKDGVYFMFHHFPPDRQGIVYRALSSDGEGEKVAEMISGRSMHRAVMVMAEAPSDLAQQQEHFSPIFRQFPSRQNCVEEAFQERYNRMKRQGLTELPKGMIVRSDNIVTLTIEQPDRHFRQTYSVDLDKGACLIGVDAHFGGKLIEKWTMEPQLVSGVWIPRRTADFHARNNGSTVTNAVDWFENRINETISEQEFSLVKMQLRRGDKIDDKRTGTMARITGGEFPPLEDVEELVKDRYFVSSRVLLAAISVVVILAAGIALYLRRRSRTARA